MLKIKNKNLIINVIFIIYLLISLIINCVELYKNEFQTDYLLCSNEEIRDLYKQEYDKATPEERKEHNLKPIEEISDEELSQLKTNMVIGILCPLIMLGILITIVKNIIIIILFIVIKVVNKKVIKEKLNKDDYRKTKEYYRDIFNGYGMCELSLIDNFEIEYPKDVIAELLQLENKKVLFIEDGKIVVNENYDYQKLTGTQKYILEHIKEGKVTSINTLELERKVKEDALQSGIIEERDVLKKKKIKMLVKAIVLFVCFEIINQVLFMSLNGAHIENATHAIVIMVLIALLSVAFAVYPIIVFISFVVYSIKSKGNSYFRTKKGEELNKNIEGIKKYIKDYSLLDKQEEKEIVLWEDYLVYSVLFAQNKKIVEQYEKYIND